MLVVGINGIALAGKDTFANIVKEIAAVEHEKVKIISSIDPIKEIYKSMGWNGEKTPEHRKALNRLKLFWIETLNGTHNWTKQQIIKAWKEDVAILFIMVREFPEMMDTIALGKEWAEKAITLEIVRDGLAIPPIEREFLDSHPAGYHYDYSVFNKTTNDPSFPELRESANRFWYTYHPSNY